MYPRDLAKRDALDYEFLYNKRGGFFETVIIRFIVAWFERVMRIGRRRPYRHPHGPLARCVGPSGKVVAVEALPHLAEKLREKFPWAKFPNVTSRAAQSVRRRAARASTGSPTMRGIAGSAAKLSVGQRNSNDHRPRDHDRRAVGDEERKVTFMKLDLEGGEFCALLGARQVISKHCPIIVFENGLEWTRRFWDTRRRISSGFLMKLVTTSTSCFTKAHR